MKGLEAQNLQNCIIDYTLELKVKRGEKKKVDKCVQALRDESDKNFKSK